MACCLDSPVCSRLSTPVSTFLSQYPENWNYLKKQGLLALSLHPSQPEASEWAEGQQCGDITRPSPVGRVLSSHSVGGQNPTATSTLTLQVCTLTFSPSQGLSAPMEQENPLRPEVNKLTDLITHRGHAGENFNAFFKEKVWKDINSGTMLL